MADAQAQDVLVLGDGGWGTALALVVLRAGHRPRLWSHDPVYAEELARTRDNRKFLPGIPLPPEIEIASDIERLAAGVAALLSAIPTQYLRGTIERIRSALPPDALYVSCSKGFEKGTLARPSEILRAALPSARIAVLSGPSHAEEVARNLPASVVVASEDPETAREAQQLVTGPRFRAYTSADPLGVEIAGATKNVIALAAGIADGLRLGDSARAALICRGASEIARLGAALGARPQTFSGLSGVGDLIATATSGHSRNRSVGLRIARGERLEEIVGAMEQVAEGVETTRAVQDLCTRLGVEMPITTEVYRVLYEGKDPLAALEDLMRREPRDE